MHNLPPARYTDDDWHIVRACFVLLRHAAGNSKWPFAEAGVVDFIEVAQIAQRMLGTKMSADRSRNSVADGIRHLLVDEFQDTSRRQHDRLRRLSPHGPTARPHRYFVVGDPMQSIYFFRDADAELFPRVKILGLEIPGAEPLLFDPVPLSSNFRTTPRHSSNTTQSTLQLKSLQPTTAAG